MATVKFEEDENLGQVATLSKIFCQIGLKPITDIEQLKCAAYGHKFSQLCGFVFDSKDTNNQYPRFLVSFVAKKRSKIFRQEVKNQSRWYVFRIISDTRMDVLDKKTLLMMYGFDIDKFFNSDVFQQKVPKFEYVVNNGIKQAEEYAKSLTPQKTKIGLKNQLEKAQEVKLLIQTLREAVDLIGTHVVEDKYYELTDNDVAMRKFMQSLTNYSPIVRKLMKKQELDKKLAAIRKDATKRMSGAVKQSDKMLKKGTDFIATKLHGTNESEYDYRCKIEKSTYEGHPSFDLIEIKSGRWVASFDEEVAAKEFAEQYPKMKNDYVKRQENKMKKMQVPGDESINEWQDDETRTKAPEEGDELWDRNQQEWVRVLNVKHDQKYPKDANMDICTVEYVEEPGNTYKTRAFNLFWHEVDESQKELDAAIEEELKEIYK